MNYDRSEQNIAEALRAIIENEFTRIGLLFRVFARIKSEDSITRKLTRKSYGGQEGDKKIQDLYGVRVALYFPDDTELAQNALKQLFEWDEKSSTIDAPTDATFGPVRFNLVFRLPSDLVTQSLVLRTEKRIDKTFEVQLRTVFSEGWHEVEHDLRYKCKQDWEPHFDLNRAMNGLYATLETCDWAMVKLFDELAWRHYKSRKWLPMLKAKFRLRWQNDELSEEVQEAFDTEPDAAKAIFRVPRQELMATIFEMRIDLPVTPSNLVYIANELFVKDVKLKAITPRPVLDELAGN